MTFVVSAIAVPTGAAVSLLARLNVMMLDVHAIVTQSYRTPVGYSSKGGNLWVISQYLAEE